MTPRTYTKRARADNEARTRRRILDATLESWVALGPASATITAIARKARVQRLTVYRHFGDDTALVAAAWKHFEEQHPSPDPAAWAAVADPVKRLRRALRSLFGWYAENSTLLGRILPEPDRLPMLAHAIAAHHRYTDGIVATLETGWTARSKDRRKLLAAAFDHAVRFTTFQSLAAAGLTDREAARLLERLVRALARKSRK